ncbi:Nucleolar complex protein 3 [Halocaridina rubra]|uniref:NOC3-like protein n=1 Tax=Halocaridina rubra TaxID=373956 RepID=A0AAN8WFH8_HALRR
MAKRGSQLAKKASKKKKVARSKMTNIQNLKRLKRKEYTEAEKKARKDTRKEKRKQTYADLYEKKLNELRHKVRFENDEEVYPVSAEVTGEEMLEMLDKDDLEYLVEKNKDVMLPDEEKDEEAGVKPYEQEERSFHPLGNQVRTLLPIKTKEGVVDRYMPLKDKSKKKKKKKKPQKENLDLQINIGNGVQDEGPEQKSVVEILAEREQKLERKKVSIGCLSVNFLENPQERFHCLNNLVTMMKERDPSISFTVRKYAAMSLLEVFQNSIPSYHIEVHDLTQKLKKDTKAQYLYENLYLKAYQTYLKELERCLLEERNSKTKDPLKKQLAMVALKCMGELLIRQAHFTYTNNIIAALVPYLNNPDDGMSKLIHSYISTLFKNDVKGDISLETIKRIDHFIRKRSYRVRLECMSVLLSLRIKNVKSLDVELEQKNIARNKLSHTEKLMRKYLEEVRQKKSNKEAKKFRKFRKLEEQKKEQIHKQAEEVRSAQHAEIIEVLFGLYFNVLKRKPNKKLNGIVLEGLAKFSHLVNIEFFSDLLNVLGELMESGSLGFRESLHCTQTVFTILSDQGEVLTIDPRRFYTYLYANMLQLTGGSNQNDIKSVLETIQQMFIQRRKRTSPGRVFAFSKRLGTLSLSLLHNGAIATLAALRSLMLIHSSSEILLEIDSDGTSGVYSNEVNDPEHSNAASATLWEVQVLNRHYHQIVRQFAEHIAIGSPLHGDKQLPSVLGKRSVQELYDEFDPAEMRFKPAIPNPEHIITKKLKTESKMNFKRPLYQWKTQYMTQEVKDVIGEALTLSNFVFENNNNNVGKGKKGKQKLKSEDDSIDFYSGMLPNINLNDVQISELPANRDATQYLVDVDKRS